MYRLIPSDWLGIDQLVAPWQQENYFCIRVIFAGTLIALASEHCPSLLRPDGNSRDFVAMFSTGGKWLELSTSRSLNRVGTLRSQTTAGYEEAIELRLTISVQ